MKKLIGTCSICFLFFAFILAVPGLQANPQVTDDPDRPIPGEMVIPQPTIDPALRLQSHPSSFGLTGPMTTSANVVDLIYQIDEALLQSYLEALVSFPPRVTGSQACKDARKYIYEEYEKLGLDVRYHNWSYSGYTGQNVEATIHDKNGTNDELFLVVGHYDAVSGSPGADDNGSGTVACLAIAKILSAFEFDYNVRFVNFDGEEQGLLGSHEYAKDAKAKGDNIVAVLNADMIAYAITTSHETNVKVYDDTASKWITTFTDNVAKQYYSQINLDVIAAGYSWGSDHTSFLQNGFDAVFYHEYKFNDYYHSPQDNLAHINYLYYKRCTQLVLATLVELGGPFSAKPLYANNYTLDSRSADTVGFYLDAEAVNANRNYLLLASASGTVPGIALPGGLATMPLNWDNVTDLVVMNINSPVFSQFMGTLDANGEATAQLNTLGALDPATVGMDLYFAFACNGPWDFVSNPVAVEIVNY